MSTENNNEDIEHYWLREKKKALGLKTSSNLSSIKQEWSEFFFKTKNNELQVDNETDILPADKVVIDEEIVNCEDLTVEGNTNSPDYKIDKLITRYLIRIICSSLEWKKTKPSHAKTKPNQKHTICKKHKVEKSWFAAKSWTLLVNGRLGK